MVHLLSDSIVSPISAREERQNLQFAVSPFVNEEMIVNAFRSFVTERDNIQLYRQYIEMETGNGVCDIVLMKRRKDWDKHSCLASLNPNWVNPFIDLPYRKTFSPDALLQSTCYSPSTVEKLLKQCERIGYVKRCRSGWMKVVQPRPPFTQIFAVEAKRRDWKRALFQATRYLEFANQAWVLLDNFHSRPAIANIAQFRKRNVGLFTIGSDGRLTTIFAPLFRQPKLEYRHWYTMIRALKLDVIEDTA